MNYVSGSIVYISNKMRDSVDLPERSRKMIFGQSSFSEASGALPDSDVIFVL